MKIPNSISIETFTPLEVDTLAELNAFDVTPPANVFDLVFFNDVTNNQIIVDIYLEKRLVEHISSAGVLDFFTKYINPAISIGDETTLTDDVDLYIDNNILPRYKVEETELFLLKSTNEFITDTQPLLNSKKTNVEKIQAGLQLDKSYDITLKDSNNNFNFRLIYNTRPGEFYSLAPSFKITKI